MNKENRLIFKDSFDEKMKKAWDEDIFNKKLESSKKAKDARKKHQDIADDLFEEQEKDEANTKKYLDKTAKVSERIKALKKIMGKDKKIDYQGIVYLNKNGKIYYNFKGPKYYPVEKKLNALRDYHLTMSNPQTVDKKKAKQIAKQLSE